MFDSEAAITVVFAFKTVWEFYIVLRGKGSARRLRPIEPEKAACATHLIAAIHHDRVVNSGTGEAIVPRRLAVVEIRPGIACQVKAMPPQIDVQLIGLKGPARVASGAHQCP